MHSHTYKQRYQESWHVKCKKDRLEYLPLSYPLHNTHTHIHLSSPEVIKVSVQSVSQSLSLSVSGIQTPILSFLLFPFLLTLSPTYIHITHFNTVSNKYNSLPFESVLFSFLPPFRFSQFEATCTHAHITCKCNYTKKARTSFGISMHAHMHKCKIHKTIICKPTESALRRHTCIN